MCAFTVSECHTNFVRVISAEMIVQSLQACAFLRTRLKRAISNDKSDAHGIQWVYSHCSGEHAKISYAVTQPSLLSFSSLPLLPSAFGASLISTRVC